MKKYIQNINWCLIGFSIFFLLGCGKDLEKEGMMLPGNFQRNEKPVISLVTDSGTEVYSPSYHLDSIKDHSHLEALFQDYSAIQKEIIYSLNRIDPQRIVPGLILILPDSISERFFDYSPFPENLELLESLPKALLVSQRVQAFAIYENGALCRWGPVSSGKQSTPTPNGLHYANYKAKRKISTVNASWIMPYYFNFMNFEGLALHQYTLPGFPASHSCVRLFMEDAKYIYYWADMWQLSGDQIKRNGTPIMIFGSYDFIAPVPWLELAEDPRSNFINREELDTIKNYIQRFQADSLNFIKAISLEKQVLL
ncbi:L,D-transpeptidase [Salegentibacter sp. F14]